MSFSFCRGCGNRIHETAPACPECGAPQAALATTQDSSKNISSHWKERFDLIEKIGWDEGMLKNYSNYKQLTFSERHKVSFNTLAALFGPLYYLVKGMWAKAILIFLAATAVSSTLLAVEYYPSAITMGLVAGWCGSLANYDYYRLRVKNKQF